jgi:hypothetical protein
MEFDLLRKTDLANIDITLDDAGIDAETPTDWTSMRHLARDQLIIRLRGAMTTGLALKRCSQGWPTSPLLNIRTSPQLGLR